MSGTLSFPLPPSHQVRLEEAVTCMILCGNSEVGDLLTELKRARKDLRVDVEGQQAEERVEAEGPEGGTIEAREADWQAAAHDVTSALFGSVPQLGLHKDVLDQMWAWASCSSQYMALHQVKVLMPNYLSVVVEPVETMIAMLPEAVGKAIVDHVAPWLYHRLWAHHMRSRSECNWLLLTYRIVNRYTQAPEPPRLLLRPRSGAFAPVPMGLAPLAPPPERVLAPRPGGGGGSLAIAHAVPRGDILMGGVRDCAHVGGDNAVTEGPAGLEARPIPLHAVDFGTRVASHMGPLVRFSFPDK